MALFRKASGGGFLDGVSGIITGYAFDAKVWGEGNKAYTSLSAELQIQQDGANDSVSQFLNAGFLHDGDAISKDGLTLIPAEDGRPVVLDTSEFGRFVQSAIECGVPESDFPENGTNFEALCNYRYTFAKELNTERQMAAGRKKLGAKAKTATNEEIMVAGRRKDANDPKKTYNHDRLIVSAVLGAAGAKPVAQKKSTNGSDKAIATSATRSGNGTPPDPDTVLLAILANAEKHTIPYTSLSSLVIRYSLERDWQGPIREPLKKQLISDAYLADAALRGLITVNLADKRNTSIALAKDNIPF